MVISQCVFGHRGVFPARRGIGAGLWVHQLARVAQLGLAGCTASARSPSQSVRNPTKEFQLRVLGVTRKQGDSDFGQSRFFDCAKYGTANDSKLRSLNGCAELISTRFGDDVLVRPPQRVTDETKEYQRQEDVVGRFVDECCDLGNGRKVQAGKLYTAYKDFCKREGIEKPATSNKFADAIQRVKGADGRRIGKSKKDPVGGRKYYDGIGLHAEDEQDPREVPDDDPESWSF